MVEVELLLEALMDVTEVLEALLTEVVVGAYTKAKAPVAVAGTLSA